MFADKKTSKDLCVICRRDTEYTTDTPIWERKNYIEGAGQLCSICAKEIELQILKEEMGCNQNG